MDQEIIGELHGRRILHWNFRGLVQLPEELKSHGELIEEMYLKWNNLLTLPVWVKEMKFLKCLYLFGNGLEYLPEEIGELKYLSTLDLENNNLKHLPKTIGNLRNLNYLNLQYNSIKSLPEEVCGWKSLYVLNLKANGLICLPNSFCQLRSLQEVNFDNNQLSHLPREMVYLPNLTCVSVNSNSLIYLPSIWFISSPHFYFAHNSYINYIAFEIGEALTRVMTDLIIEGDLWHINTLGCFERSVGQSDLISNLKVMVPESGQCLVFPQPLHIVYQPEECFIPSLYELSIRRAEEVCFLRTDMRECTWPQGLKQLPEGLQDEIEKGGSGHCSTCHRSIFCECILYLVTKWLLVEQPPSQIISPLYFCTKTCLNTFKQNSRHTGILLNNVLWHKISSTGSI